MARAPEGREGRYQAGPKGRNLEVEARRAPRVLVLITTANCHSNTNQVAIYTGGGSQLEWRETGRLPTPRDYLKAAVVENQIYVTGGDDENGTSLTEIFTFDTFISSEGALYVMMTYYIYR